MLVRYGIPEDEFKNHIQWMVQNPNLLYQTHNTYFCGYYTFLHNWIVWDKDSFIEFISGLYYEGKVIINDEAYFVTQGLQKALEKGIKPIPPEKRDTFYEAKLPHPVELMFTLTLAQHITDKPFDNEKHDEDTPWAGIALWQAEELYKRFGFIFDTYGGSVFTTWSSSTKLKITKLMQKERLTALLLLNSKNLKMNSKFRLLDKKEEASRENLMKKFLKTIGQIGNNVFNEVVGTHWVTVWKYEKNLTWYWDYGRKEGNYFNGDIFDITTGVFILNGYKKPIIVRINKGNPDEKPPLIA